MKKAELEDVIYWTNKGLIRPLIGCSFSIQSNYRRLCENGKWGSFGKIVVTPQSI